MSNHATHEKNIAPYLAVPRKRVKRKNWRSFLIPTGWKRKKNISEHIDNIVYGK